MDPTSSSLSTSLASSSSASSAASITSESKQPVSDHAGAVSSAANAVFSSSSATSAARGPKLSTSQVFRKMASIMCLIESEKSKASGFFCSLNNEGFIVTAFHVVPEVSPGNYSVKDVTMKTRGSGFKLAPPPVFNGNRAKELDICLLKPTQCIGEQTQDIRFDIFDLLPYNQPVVEGMKVYFSGYPLTLSNITFHKGTISSVFRKNGIDYFTIDGTVVPGNSGGPVVVQIDGKLYLAGVIFSEVVHLDPNFLYLENALAELKKTGGYGGVTQGIPFPDGKVRSINDLDLISMSLSVIKQNMSTGIGKAVHAKHLLELISTQASTATIGATTTTSTDDLFVAKKRELEQELRKNGWAQSHGAKHDIWTKGAHQTTVPRHAEISDGVTRSIRQAIKDAQADEGKEGDGGDG